MADTYEKDLAQKSSLTVNDFIRVVGTDNVSYKQLVSDVAKKIIENYTGSSLAGSSQSVKSALDALNSKWTPATLLPWGTYSDGTYDLSTEIERYGMLYIAIGASGTYNFIVPCGQVGDRLKRYTEDGWVTISFPTAATVTISGTGNNSRVREIRIFKNFKFPL